MGDGGDDLKDKADILEMILLIKNKMKLKAEAAALEQKANPKLDHDNQKFKKGKVKLNVSKSKGFKNPCRKHDGTHDKKDCPDHKPTKVKGGAKVDDNSTKKDLHSMQATNKTTKKTPIVRINDQPEIKAIENHYASLDDYTSDKGSALMVQAKSNNRQVNGNTVIECPTKMKNLLGQRS